MDDGGNDQENDALSMSTSTSADHLPDILCGNSLLLHLMASTATHLHCSYRPAPPLDRFIERLWYWEGAPPAHAKDRLMPTGAGSLIINLAEDEIRSYHGPNDSALQRLPGAIIVGAYSKYTVIDTRDQRAVLGVSFDRRHDAVLRSVCGGVARHACESA